jgi:hypothetical protein
VGAPSSLGRLVAIGEIGPVSGFAKSAAGLSRNSPGTISSSSS